MNRLFKFAIVAFILPALATLPATKQKTEERVTADSAIAELKVGNKHHVQHHYRHPHQTALRQSQLTSGQHPHAEILSCSDSRVPPEIIFDQGLGDLFVVRVAGNVTADVEVGSLEYGAEHLHIPLLVVLGHEQCGAVTAALQGGPPEGHISALVNLIKPAVEKSRGLKGDPVSNAVRTNVEMVVKELRSSTPLLSELVAQHKLKIVGAVYSLETGKVTWLPENN
jgi:carbonic anhydrase